MTRIMQHLCMQMYTPGRAHDGCQQTQYQVQPTAPETVRAKMTLVLQLQAWPAEKQDQVDTPRLGALGGEWQNTCSSTVG